MIAHTTPSQAQATLDANADAVYLDVRTVDEFAAGHPSGARNVPVVLRSPGGPQPNPDFLAVVERALPKTTKLLVGCQSGGRSMIAAQQLTAAGYTDVTNVQGGFGGGTGPDGAPVAGWQASGLPVETGNPAGASYADLQAKS